MWNIEKLKEQIQWLIKQVQCLKDENCNNCFAIELFNTPQEDGVLLNTNTGGSTLIPLATTLVAGMLSPEDKEKLDNTSGTNTGDEDNASIKTKLGEATGSTDGWLSTANWNVFNNKQEALVSGTNIKTLNGNSLLGSGNLTINPTTNIGYVPSPTDGTIISSTGTDGTVPLANSTNAGLMSPAQNDNLANQSGTNSGDQDLSPYELLSNKENTILDNDATKYPTNNLVKTYVDQATVGLLDDRGEYDPTVTSDFPTTNGSGSGGNILKGDIYFINTAGAIQGEVLNIGDSVRALTDSPGSDPLNWSILEANIGYVPENVQNKKTTMTGAESNNTLYLSAKAIYDWAVGKFQNILVSGTNIKTINNISVLGSGNIPFEAITHKFVDVHLQDGSDITGAYENSSKPFKTLQAALNSIPVGEGFVTARVDGTGDVFIDEAIDLDDNEITIHCTKGANVKDTNFDAGVSGVELIKCSTPGLRAGIITDGDVILGGGTGTYDLTDNACYLTIRANKFEQLGSTFGIRECGGIDYKAKYTVGNNNNYFIYFVRGLVGSKNYLSYGAITSTVTTTNLQGRGYHLCNTNNDPESFDVEYDSIEGLNNIRPIAFGLDGAKKVNITLGVSTNQPSVTSEAVAFLNLPTGTIVDTSKVELCRIGGGTGVSGISTLTNGGTILKGGGDFSLCRYLTNSDIELREGVFYAHMISRLYTNPSINHLIFNNITLSLKSSIVNTFPIAALNYAGFPIIEVIGYVTIYSESGSNIDAFGMNTAQQSNLEVNSERGILTYRNITFNGDSVLDNDVTNVNTIHPIKMPIADSSGNIQYYWDWSNEFRTDENDFDYTGGVLSIKMNSIDVGSMSYIDDAAAGTGGVPSGNAYWNTTSSSFELKI